MKVYDIVERKTGSNDEITSGAGREPGSKSSACPIATGAGEPAVERRVSELPEDATPMVCAARPRASRAGVPTRNHLPHADLLEMVLTTRSPAGTGRLPRVRARAARLDPSGPTLVAEVPPSSLDCMTSTGGGRMAIRRNAKRVAHERH